VNNSISKTGVAKKELIAEIAINSSSKANKVIELDVSYNEIRDILRSL
jgi:hypothetical protein